MSEAKHVIPTRQKADSLHDITAPIESGESRVLAVREVLGYSVIQLFGIGDQPFEIAVQGGCSETGPFVQLSTFTSTPAGPLNMVCERAEPCAPFMRLILTTPGVSQTSFSLCIHGLPIG